MPLTVALREAPAQGGDIKLVDGDGVLYRLCGLGPNCAIAKGKPSAERHLLLRREALELALYTLPLPRRRRPGRRLHAAAARAKKPSQALLFRRGDVEAAARRAR